MRTINKKKLEKTRALLEQDLSVSAIANKVGATSNTIRTWKKLLDAQKTPANTTEPTTQRVFDVSKKRTRKTQETDELSANLAALIQEQEARLFALRSAQSLIFPD